MGSRTSRMVPDGLPKIPKPSRPSAFFYSDLARSAEKVSRSVKEGHGRVSEHREHMPKNPDFCEFRFREPFGGLKSGHQVLVWNVDTVF